jgi:tryptophan-rich sensory protein
MGISAALVITSASSPQVKSLSIRVYAFQLFLNFLWPLLFFGAGAYTLAGVELALLLFTVIIMTYLFSKSNKAAAFLQIPYILWLAFAFYLNIAVAVLN